MVRASALSIVIVIALLIGVLCSSLIAVGYYYRLQGQQQLRYDRLENNLQSGINLLLGSKTDQGAAIKSSLFGADQDSVILQQLPWGLYPVCIAQAFIQRDTLYKAFSIGNAVDSAKWSALYVIDEDRPISVSGKTLIKGNAFLPKAGVRQAYVDNKAYEGDKRIVLGQTHNSDKTLPALNSVLLQQLENGFKTPAATDSGFNRIDSVRVSFRHPARIFYLSKRPEEISNLKLSGHVILRSDTTLIFDSTCHFNHVLVFAKAIIVKSGFKGSCQFFALDSIRIGAGCMLDYPSALGIISQEEKPVKVAAQINIGKGSIIKGTIFTYEKTENDIKPIISLDKQTKLYGQVYASGWLSYKDSVAVFGSLTTRRFLYQTTFTRYENYLINMTVDNSRLSRYYLSSGLMPAAANTQKIMEWIEGN